MSIRISVGGLEGLLKSLVEMNESSRAAGRRAIARACLEAENSAKLACPVDTGRLRSSIRSDLDNVQELQGSIFTDVEYAPHVEFGTSRRGAHPFMTPAVLEAETRFPAILGEELLRGIP